MHDLFVMSSVKEFAVLRAVSFPAAQVPSDTLRESSRGIVGGFKGSTWTVTP
jgi:hypothetical protein